MILVRSGLGLGPRLLMRFMSLVRSPLGIDEDVMINLNVEHRQI